MLKPLRPGEIQGIYITGDLAAAELAWKPKVALKDGLAKTVAFIQERPKQTENNESES